MTTERKIEPGPNDLVFNLYTVTYGNRDDRDYLTTYGSSWDRTKSGRYFVPEYLSGSDYSGSLVERSNHKVWAEQFDAGNDVWWFDACGGYGTYAIVVDSHNIPDDVLPEVDDFLSGLANYPLADEGAHSAMECEAQDKAYQDWGRSEFVRTLENVHHVELDTVAESDVDELFEAARDAANVYWENQSGSDVYIDVDRIAGEVTAQMLKSYLGAASRFPAE